VGIEHHRPGAVAGTDRLLVLEPGARGGLLELVDARVPERHCWYLASAPALVPALARSIDGPTRGAALAGADVVENLVPVT
jgi:hypothetical protein